ncbi:uncharacterized protein K452DRAFT_308407 [Aplosporella prunicola CBS 121167]|uniref:NTF2 domain-containing protein n=1 Tax=Aplosporella prunicola CBS 121167 TaxID=1176127 RepID=A0A6A6BCS6_9PEZI|nr:uncharacterized protein K452DRAFT_308407 [Aplosporella prunicola CBS 121167]KAF2141999.1 hypothetical protein K452DRAFT_308407 [Aplosporella prunicola CBS 121167]
MATEQQAMNGSFGQQTQAYEHVYSQQNAAQAPAHTTSGSSNANGASDIPKDEVGWYFVEQYYTTLSRSPEKLFLFYNKRSQFVSGVEEQKVDVCVGQKAINDRIKELDFENTKVRITNVDSQGSDSNIVIQVIGEISNKAQPHRKFVQTFVLAAQTNGYFVLNDIFRYIQEEEDIAEEELAQEPAAVPSGVEEPVPTAEEPETQAEAPETVTNEEEVAQVDDKLEEVKEQEQETERKASPPPGQVNGTPVPEAAEVAQADEAPAAAVSTTEEAPSAEEAQAAVAEEAAAEAEKPQDPSPTPAAPAAAKPAAAAAPAAPAKPAVPMSWAAKAAAAAGNRAVAPAVPAVPTQAPKAAPATQAKPAAAPAAAASSAAGSSAARSGSPADTTQDGWQTAGAEHNKRQSRVQNQPPNESGTVRAYIKNVFESTDADALKGVLSKFDKITYFDVSRPKNAAFVEFATQEGFQAAVAANPHKVGDDTIYVEERRQPGNFGRFPARGGSMRGRGGADRPGQGRGGFNKDGGRGGFTPRGRGGAATPRRGGGAAA